MTIDEAIRKYDDSSEYLRAKGYNTNAAANKCTDKGRDYYRQSGEHKQVAEWLREFKALRAQAREKPHEEAVKGEKVW